MWRHGHAQCLALARRTYATSTLPHRVIPKLDRTVSRIGFGAYRVSTEKHAEALRNALQNGVNIIDTAANFENGRSEAVVGETLAALESSKQIQRESVTLVTKAGYLTSADIDPSNNDYIQINDHSYHSISPSILEKQIKTSLDRLKTSKLDIFMINAPERMLMAKNRRYTATQLYKDLEETFEFLDSQVDSGIIGGYGVCSNSMALPLAVDHVSLSKVLQSCKNLSNFVAVEVPFNLFEREAILNSDSVSDVSKKHDIFVMTNRPLNSIANGKIRMLVNHTMGNGVSAEHELMETMTRSFKQVSKLEAEMASELPVEEESLTAKFVWGQVLSENLTRLAQNHFATQHYLLRQVKPAVAKDIKELQGFVDQLPAEEQKPYADWMTKYQQGVDVLMDNIVSYAYMDTLRKNSELDRIMSALCPSLGKQSEGEIHSPLSIKALRFLLAHEQVGTVFTGMRDPLYVRDAMTAAQRSVDQPIDPEDIADLLSFLEHNT
ncbi:hypothetical protein EC973_008514 [Apophysomyces ossiformis]|uniref:NADP-dependent oxidoreductase domain-containing protein n=1 Tax=Apophysomyces ossiformis TaxID=679940 RepID=A0A8H7ER12_9FUNG|nr:hypothetical protein EC973_008514 [Apophysomyces ossiformis]